MATLNPEPWPSGESPTPISTGETAVYIQGLTLEDTGWEGNPEALDRSLCDGVVTSFWRVPPTPQRLRVRR